MRGKKRADITWWTLVKAIPAMAVFAFLLYGASELASSDYFFKIYAAKDVSALTESVQAVPGEVNIFYPSNMSDFQVQIKGQSVSVTSSHLDPTSGKASFSKVKDYDINGKLTGFSHVYFQGSPSSLSLVGSTEVIESEKSHSCPRINTQGTITDKTLIIDPGILNNPEELFAIANFIYHDRASHFREIITRPRNAPTPASQRAKSIGSDASIVIGLRSQVSSRHEIPSLAVSISPATQSPSKSTKLACLIQNRIVSVLPELEREPRLYSTSDPVINRNPLGLAVLIEFRFPDQESASKMLSKQSDIAKAILHSLNTYYGDGDEEVE